ncbi:DUF3617 domain-containing protein [Sphingomonas silueang]|uniref:DUF3617 domain-containing protein n=1 Tax=Sphingomonas silueang TaxID=3156617 RepID=UPI0032B33C91
MWLWLLALLLGQDDEVVVTGQRPSMTPGLWQFDRSDTKREGISAASKTRGGGASQPPKAYRWGYCVVSPDIRTALPYALAGSGEYRGGPGCPAFRFTIDGNQIVAKQECRFRWGETAHVLRGTASGDRLLLQSRMTSPQTSLTLTHSIEGRRIGDCPPRR